MTQLSDRELERLAIDWQAIDAPGPGPTAIRDYVRARSRLLWWWMAGELAVGAVALPPLCYLAWTARSTGDRLAMVALSALTVGAVAVGWWNWRGALYASAQSTSAYVELSTRRLRAVRRAYWAGWLILLVEVAILSAWISHRVAGAAPPAPFAWGLLATLTGGAIVFLLAVRRFIVRDVHAFETLRRELDG